MANGTTDPWYDSEKKVDALFKVLRHVAEFPEKGLDCVGDDTKANTLFLEQGEIEVPQADGARVIFFKPGEKALLHGGSIIIEIPPRKIVGAPDEQLMNYLLTSYPYWPVGSQAALANLLNWKMDRVP
jgi:hypothetical protein